MVNPVTSTDPGLRVSWVKFEATHEMFVEVPVLTYCRSEEKEVIDGAAREFSGMI